MSPMNRKEMIVTGRDYIANSPSFSKHLNETQACVTFDSKSQHTCIKSTKKNSCFKGEQMNKPADRSICILSTCGKKNLALLKGS